MRIIYHQEPSGKCPVQAEGTIDGLPFYFRARGGNWRLSVSPDASKDPAYSSKAVSVVEEYDGIHRDEPQDYHGILVQFGAGYAERKECIAFIERAAKTIMERIYIEQR